MQLVSCTRRHDLCKYRGQQGVPVSGILVQRKVQIYQLHPGWPSGSSNRLAYSLLHVPRHSHFPQYRAPRYPHRLAHVQDAESGSHSPFRCGPCAHDHKTKKVKQSTHRIACICNHVDPMTCSGFQVEIAANISTWENRVTTPRLLLPEQDERNAFNWRHSSQINITFPDILEDGIHHTDVSQVFEDRLHRMVVFLDVNISQTIHGLSGSTFKYPTGKEFGKRQSHTQAHPQSR